jgi:multidrug efflux pump subunit AcrB
VKNVKDLDDLPIRLDGPRNTVYLRDIGHAEDSYAIQTSRVHIDNRREVYVPIYRQQGASSLAVAESVRNSLADMMARLDSIPGYQGTKLGFVMDQSIYVREAIKSLIHEAVIGAALVSLMILIFLGNWRMTVIATMSIPLAILCSIVGLFATGNTINAMTLGGLALAIGPLVDDAIVVLENTHRHHQLGKSPIKAAFDGAVEVTIPVLVATSTTIIVLCPIALMAGMGGFLFRPLTLAVAFAMIASFILSRTFVPVLCAKWLGTTHGEEHASVGAAIHRRIERGLNFVTRRYERLLAIALRHRAPVLVAVGLLFAGSLALTLGIGREFFPQVDAGQITIYLRAPSNDRLDAAERRVSEVEHFLEDHIPAEERVKIVTELGLDPDWSSAYTANSGQQDALIRVQLSDERRLSAQEYAIQLRHLFAEEPRFADLRVSFDTGGMVSAALNYGAASPIDIEIQGGTRRQALALAREIRNRIAEVPGAADVRVLQRLDAPYLIINVDRKKAASVGLSAQDVILQVVAAMNSSVSINRNFWIDAKSGNQYFVAVQYPGNPNMRLDNVLNVVATGTNQGSPVKLSSLVTIQRRTEAVEVNHVSLYRTFDVLVNTEKRDIGGVAEDIQHQLRTLEVPQGMHWHLKGEYARMNESFSDLGKGLMMAAILVYLLMVPLFRSFLGPFIIMFTVPLGLIGVLAMLFLTHTTLNVQSEMGVIFLVGIVVSNGVLLVDFANKQRRLGASVSKAITTAAAIRFRPIMMTFLATFLDLVPMAIGFGKGSEANVPLARAVVGGLLTSTFLTLIVVPILYTLLIRDRAEMEIDIDAELGDLSQQTAGLVRGGELGAVSVNHEGGGEREVSAAGPLPP